MDEIREALKATQETLKLDLDGPPYPEWWRLIRLLNFVNLFTKTRIERHPMKNAYHLFAEGVESTLHLRMMFDECHGRLYMSQKRLELIGEPGDIIFQWKGLFKYILTKKGLITRWIKKPVRYEPCMLKDVLALPFWSQIDTHHRISRVKWLKRQKGLKKETERKIKGLS
jgi:hypothetical protein